MSAVTFSKLDAQGHTVLHHCRIGDDLLPDDPELLAQGRLAENSQRKRDHNRLPAFPTFQAAKQAFANNQIPVSYGDWSTWRHRIDADLDAFRADYRVKNGLAA